MNVGELIHAVQRLVHEGNSGNAANVLAREALALTDMVGWASNAIDGNAVVDGKLDTLQSALRERHAAAPDDGIAVLHDALGELRNAIARHDLDVTGDSDDDHTVDM